MAALGDRSPTDERTATAAESTIRDRSRMLGPPDPSLQAQVATTPPWLRMAPFPLLVISALLGWLLTPELLQPERMQLSYAPTIMLAVIRMLAEVAHERLRVAGPLVVAGYVMHAIVLVAAVALNPFVCIYAFFGYLDADRFLGERIAPAAVVITGLTCAFGQSGGLPGVTATPALFAGLAAVNVALAWTMMRITVSREREVEARAQAVEELARAHRENLALQDQLLRQAHETGIVEERSRLSRELHDTVAQGLVGVIRQLENLPTEVDPTIRQRVERAERTARECLT
ncbi:MAG: histidine kinase, partial [Microlunatus sp.]|nr:histidine kinase [Microlunatus sp.]